MTVRRTSSAQTRDDARVNEEREEAEVMIACGFDVHRAQITFDLVDHETGELRRGRIVPATREQLRRWLSELETSRLVVRWRGRPAGGSWPRRSRRRERAR